MNIEEQLATAKANKVVSLGKKQEEKIRKEEAARKLELDKKFLKEGKCWYDLFYGKGELVDELYDYMCRHCMERVIVHGDEMNVGVTVDFIAGIRHFLDMMKTYPIDYAETMTKVGGKVS